MSEANELEALREQTRVLRAALEQTKLDLQRAGKQVENLQAEANHQRMAAENSLNQMLEMRESTSWRLTAPLRALAPHRPPRGVKKKQPRSKEPSIVQRFRDQVTLEAGDESILNGAKKVALVAAWTKTETQSKSISVYLGELAQAGYAIVFISTSEAPGKLTFPHGLPQDTIVLRRPNVGYDFGSWALALDRYPQVRQAQHVLITNDSMLGPFKPIQELLRQAEAPGADITAATLSLQITVHFQSFFVIFHDGVLDREPWRKFFDSIQEKKDKMDVVYAYEFGMHALCTRHSFSHRELFLPTDVNASTENPTLASWAALVNKGFPFIKRTIYADPTTAHGGENLANFVRFHFDQDVEDWV